MMRTRSSVTIALLSSLLVGFLFMDFVEARRGGGGTVSVRGYVRKDGTYVAPHYRSSSDGNPYNNWSFPGNTNPYTGKTATGNPSTYLERYYQRQGSSSEIASPPPATAPSVPPSAPVSPITVPPHPQATADRPRSSATFQEESASLSAHSSNFLKTLQQELKASGFDPGPATGHMDNVTQQALKRFQQVHGLSATGELDIPTLTTLVERNLQR
jgi:Putative peptidoglycan binding domain